MFLIQLCLTSQVKLKTIGYCFRRLKLSNVFTTFSLFRICQALCNNSVPTTIWDVKDTPEFIHLLVTISKKMSCQEMSRCHSSNKERDLGITKPWNAANFVIATKHCFEFYHNTNCLYPQEIQQTFYTFRFQHVVCPKANIFNILWLPLFALW